jgi:hypothetical protein
MTRSENRAKNIQPGLVQENSAATAKISPDWQLSSIAICGERTKALANVELRFLLLRNRLCILFGGNKSAEAIALTVEVTVTIADKPRVSAAI